MPFGMSEKIKFDLYEMVNLKNKIGLFYSYLYSLNLPMYNLFTYLNKPTYLGITCQHFIGHKLDDLNFFN
jgi:hypothetical protein